MPERPRTRRAAVVAIAVTLVAIAAAAVAARRELAPDGGGIDDAYIFLRYARNLIEGHGWVWNPGGERVEGTTSPLWTLVVAGATALAGDPRGLLFAAAVVLLGTALGAYLAASLGRGAAAGDAAGAAAALGLFLAAQPSFAVWTAASLMDTALWSTGVAAAAASAIGLAGAAEEARAERRATAAAAAAQVALALCRPEALVVGPLVLVAAALSCRRPLRVWAAPAAAAAAAQLALVTARLAYFGWPLPNTYYAKLGDDLAARFAAGRAWLELAAATDPVRPWIWALAALALVALAVGRLRPASTAGRDESALAVAATLVLAGPALALAEGGDYFPGARTLVALRPFGGVLVLLVARRVAAALGNPARATAAAALALAAVAASAYGAQAARWGALATTTRHAVDFDTARQGLDAAARLERLFGASRALPRVGTLAAGALPWAWRGASRDLLGLNDGALAHASRRRAGLHGHSAFAADAFFADPPELALIGPIDCPGTLAERASRRLAFRVGLADLDADPRLAARYALVEWLDPATDAPLLCAFGRRDWLDAGSSGARHRLAPAPASGAKRGATSGDAPPHRRLAVLPATVVDFPPSVAKRPAREELRGNPQ